MFARELAAIAEPLVVAVFEYGTTADMPVNRASAKRVRTVGESLQCESEKISSADFHIAGTSIPGRCVSLRRDVSRVLRADSSLGTADVVGMNRK